MVKKREMLIECHSQIFGIQTLIPQFNADMMKPENADKLEAELKNYPLDQFVELGNKIQRSKNDYLKKESGMTQKEKDAYQAV